MKTFVIDASVAVKWLLRESYRSEAKRFVEANIHRIAPDLILIECTNAIRRKVLLKDINQEEGDIAFFLMKEWFKELIRMIPSVELIERAYELSKELEKHPVPDCLYLALAERDKSILVTADERFFKRVKSSRYAKNIAWFEEQP